MTATQDPLDALRYWATAPSTLSGEPIPARVRVVMNEAGDAIADLRAEVKRLQADVAAASAEIANLTAERERLLDAAAARGIYPTEGS